MCFPPIHRVVTGHDAEGKAVAASNGPLPTVVELKALPGTVFHEVWSTTGAPAAVGNGADPTPGPLMLPPHGFTISCFPHKIRGASAGWTRAVAIFEN